MAAEGGIWRWGWGRRCPGRPGLPGPGPGPTTPLLLILLLGSVAADITDGNSEHLKREHSLIKPYQGEAWGGNECRVKARLHRVGKGSAFSPEQGSSLGFLPLTRPVLAWPVAHLSVPVTLPTGVGSSSMPLWDFQGSTILTSQYVRLTPDERSKEGSIWNHQVSGSPEARHTLRKATTPSLRCSPESGWKACPPRPRPFPGLVPSTGNNRQWLLKLFCVGSWA